MYDFITTLFLNVENKPSIEYEYKFGEGIVIKSLAEKNSIVKAIKGEDIGTLVYN